MVFDLSSKTLSDGCIGIISMTNNNWSSKLSITFGDVYLSGATNPYYATLSGGYVEDDGNVLEYSSDANCVSLDMSKVTDLPVTLPWLSGNRIVYVAQDVNLTNANVVRGDSCSRLTLTPDGGDFRPMRAFTAHQAELTLDVDEYSFVMVPFNASVPAGTEVYVVTSELGLERTDTILAHTPVVIKGQGTVTIKGSGNVSYRSLALSAMFRGVYVESSLRTGDYVLDCQDSRWGFRRITSATVLNPFGVYAQLSSKESFIPLQGDVLKVDLFTRPKAEQTVYDLMGRKVVGGNLSPGIYIINGRKVVVR